MRTENLSYCCAQFLALTLLAFTLTAHAQSCPQYAPFQPTLLNFRADGTSCWKCEAPLDMTLAAAFIPAAGGPNATAMPYYPVEPCDVVTFHFDDGTPDATLTGTASITHHYASPGVIQPTVTVSNARGTRTSELSPILLTATPAAVVSFSQPKYTVVENAGSITIPVERSGNLTATSTVYWSSTCPETCDPRVPPADPVLQNSSGTLVFAPGETEKTITLALYDDSIYSGDRDRFVNIKAFDGTFIGGFYAGQQHPASETSTNVHVIDDEPQPVVTIDDVTVPESAGKAHFTVHLSAPIGATQFSNSTFYVWFTHDGTAIHGVDYTAPVGWGELTIPAGATSGSFDVPILDNDQPEPDKTFTVELEIHSTPSAAPGRGTATCTIRNDNFFVPSSLRLATGDHASIAFDAVTPFAADTTLTLTSDDPSVLSVPSSITIPAGKATTTFDVAALQPGSTSVNVTVRGVTGHARVLVSDPVAIVAKPAALKLRAGDRATVTLAIAPASATTKFLTVLASDATLIQVPASATIPPGGSADIAVSALRAGGGSIQLADPSSGAMTSIPVDIVSANAPVTDAIVPNVGPAAGGTHVTLVGSHFDAPCAVSFGTVAGTSVEAHGDTLSVITPAHAEGVVDVIVTCGSDQVTLTNAFTYARGRRRAGR
jgi:PKD repeat protein